MSAPDLLFVAAPTHRSRAYAQAMARASLAPSRVLLLGSSPAPGWPDAPNPESIGDLFLPDLSVPLARTCVAAGWEVQTIPCDSVNNREVIESITESSPALVIYSGFPGEIVGQDALAAAPFLHMHAGWLPEERGSTTIYYGMLRSRSCAVSALLLESDIDAGPIVARKRYPLPPADLDVDHLYDGAIRADLLVQVLKQQAAHGRLSRVAPQEGIEDSTYYVIHPVLKHIARLSLSATDPMEVSTAKD